MSKRKCDACGKEKDVKGGKTCENGHFYVQAAFTADYLGEHEKHVHYAGNL